MGLKASSVRTTFFLAPDKEDRRLRFEHTLSDYGVRHYVENKR